ncbi:hypothetical protein EPN42_11755 [bacterium]|nr:MAG: hypothetical protein EPN42_11755 [bacterium]
MTDVLIVDEVGCAADRVPELLSAVLKAQPGGEASGYYRLEVPFEELGLPDVGEFSRRVDVRLGTPQSRPVFGSLNELRIPLSWEVPGHAAFPVFEGFLEVTPLAQQRSQLTVAGAYRPPGGPVGAAFDAAIGHRIAEATIRHFLSGLRHAIEARAVS